MTPIEFNKKFKAFSYLDRKLDEIARKGKTVVKVCGTGYEYVVNENDVMHQKMKADREVLAFEISSHEIIKRGNAVLVTSVTPTTTVRRRGILPAPVSASCETAKEKKNALRKKYYRSHKDQCKAYAKKYYETHKEEIKARQKAQYDRAKAVKISANPVPAN